MKFIEKIAAVFVAMVCVFSFSFRASANEIDFLEWNEHESVIMVADPSSQSHSALKSAQLKVKYDYQSNRMIMFLMLSFPSMEEDADLSVRFSINGGEELSFNLRGETEYNEEEYYLEVVSVADYKSGNIAFEIIFAVKDGIPEKREMKFVFRGADGILSNTYTVNLNEEEETVTEEETTSKTNKTNKTNKTKTEKTSKTEEEESMAVALIIEKDSSDSGAEHLVFVNNRVLFIIVSAIVLAGLAFSGGIHYLKRKKHKGDKG